MDLYLIRHADALPLDTPGIENDEDRPLSELGNQQALHLGQVFRAKGLVPEVIASSPLLRARQTSAGLRETLGLRPDQVLTRDELSPGARLRKLSRFLNGLAEHSVALIGHEPGLSKACAWLIGNKRAQLSFAKSGAALIRTEGMFQKGCGVLIWLVTPEWLA